MLIHFGILESQCAIIHPCCSAKVDTEHKSTLYLSKKILNWGFNYPVVWHEKDLWVHCPLQSSVWEQAF